MWKLSKKRLITKGRVVNVIVMGVDPSLTGNPVGIVIIDEREMISLHRESMPACDSWEDTLDAMVHRVEILLALFEIQVIGYEMVWIGNKQWAIQLAHMGGALRALGAGSGIRVYGSLPAEIKQALTGDHKSGKGAMIKSAKLVFSQNRVNEHEADGYGAALSAANKHRIANLERLVQERMDE